jgi:hypothetical protein
MLNLNQLSELSGKWWAIYLHVWRQKHMKCAVAAIKWENVLENVLSVLDEMKEWGFKMKL